jgi:hypothetical protein
MQISVQREPLLAACKLADKAIPGKAFDARPRRGPRAGALDADQTLRLELPDAEGPALFRAGPDYRHVLMPLRYS